MKNSFFQKDRQQRQGMISPQRALFTAMSTTLGISTIVGPTIAVHLGGPGALLGFLITSFLGSAATFVEVNLAIQHRKKLINSAIMGGPMQYMEFLLSPMAAKWYAVCCLILMIAWSGAQANQVAAILDSPLLGVCRIPTLVSGSLMAMFILAILLGGIKRVGSFSAKLVPTMFLLYIGATLWILFSDFDRLGAIFHEIWSSAFFPRAIGTGAIVGGITATLRWGIFKGIQTCEAGIGTQSIPHSMADTQDEQMQGTLAMLSTVTAGVIAFLSGCVALATNTWQDPNIPLGVSMVAASFKLHFSSFGIVIVVLSSLLFGFGTILGNSYNGSQCFGYLTSNTKRLYYFAATAAMIVLGAIGDVKMFWSLTDIILAAVVIPHMWVLLLYVFKQKELTCKI